MRFSSFVGLVALAFFSASPGSAQLVDLGTSTRDDATGLDWLDLTQSGGLTFDAVAASTSSFSLDGWRHANTGEVCGLFASYATTVNPCPNDLIFSAPTGSQDTFVDLLGVTGTSFVNGDFARGLFDDSDSGVDLGAYGFAFVSKGNGQATVRIQADGYPTGIFQVGQPLPDSGHFLVRNSGVIPEPSSAALLALGLAGLTLRSRAHSRSR